MLEDTALSSKDSRLRMRLRQFIAHPQDDRTRVRGSNSERRLAMRQALPKRGNGLLELFAPRRLGFQPNRCFSVATIVQVPSSVGMVGFLAPCSSE